MVSPTSCVRGNRIWVFLLRRVSARSGCDVERQRWTDDLLAWAVRRAVAPGIAPRCPGVEARRKTFLEPARIMASSSNRTMRNECLTEPGYFTLRTLAAYSNCSTRWLRDRLVDRAHPLPHYRIGGKLLVKCDDFDQWMNVHRVVHPSDQLSQIVDSVVAQLHSPQ